MSKLQKSMTLNAAERINARRATFEAKKSEKLSNDKNIITARELWAYHLVYWISSYKALLKYISKDYVDIFQPIVKGNDSGRRYFIEVGNVKTFLAKFESNELSKKKSVVA